MSNGTATPRQPLVSRHQVNFGGIREPAIGKLTCPGKWQRGIPTVSAPKLPPPEVTAEEGWLSFARVWNAGLRDAERSKRPPNTRKPLAEGGWQKLLWRRPTLWCCLQEQPRQTE